MSRHLHWLATGLLVLAGGLQVATAAEAPLKALGSANEEERVAARDALAADGVGVIADLLKVCDGEDRTAGKMAAQALRRIVFAAAGTPASKDAEAALSKELSKQHTLATRQEICRLIGEVGGDVAAEALAPLLDDKDLREIALYALIRTPSTTSAKSQDVIIDRVKAAPAGAWRSALLDALAEKHARRAAPVLLEMFRPLTNQPASAPEGEATTAPASQPEPEGTPEEKAARRREKLELMGVMSQIPDFRCMRAISREFVNGDVEVGGLLLRCGEMLLAQGLAVEGEEAIAVVGIVTPPLSVAERCELCADIAQIGSEDATNLVLSELENANPRIRICTANACRMLKGEYATNEIAKRLAEAKLDMKVALLGVLGDRGDTMTPQAIDAMIAALADPDEEVKLAALAALQKAGIAEARPAIRKLLESNPKEKVRLAAENTLYRLPAVSTRPASRPATQASAPASQPKP